MNADKNTNEKHCVLTETLHVKLNVIFLKEEMSCGSWKCIVKSVQSALSDLLTTSATHGTSSRPSTKRGLILIGLELNTNARESFEHC